MRQTEKLLLQKALAANTYEEGLAVFHEMEQHYQKRRVSEEIHNRIFAIVFRDRTPVHSRPEIQL